MKKTSIGARIDKVNGNVYNAVEKGVLKPDITENQFREQIRDLSKLFGWLFYFTWRSYHSPSGYPDITLVRPPRVILAELKTEKGQPTESQWIWLYTLQNCPGIECYLWKPSDFEEIVEIIK